LKNEPKTPRKSRFNQLDSLDLQLLVSIYFPHFIWLMHNSSAAIADRWMDGWMVALLLNTFHRKLHGINQRSPPHIATQITWAVGKPGKGGRGHDFSIETCAVQLFHASVAALN